MNDAADDILNPDITTAEAAAAFWLVRRDQGAALEQDPNFTSWISASQRNALAWKKTVAVWNDLESADDPLLDAMRKDALSARRPPAYLDVRWAAIAAALLIMVCGVIGWNIFATPSSDGLGQLVAADVRPTFATDASGPATFALPDGSSVTLDANSALAVQYDEKSRAVRLLRGHAFFSVVHNSARPFTADVGAGTISDLGTEFDVFARGEGLSVTLISGSVAVASPGAKAATLKPGERLDAMPGQPSQVTAVGTQSALAWRTGYQEFSDEPLEKAIAQINRYGGAPARVVDPSILGVRVSGRFRAGDPSRFARTLAEIYPLRLADRADGGVDIARR